MMGRRDFLSFTAMLGALGLSGCAKQQSYRYKLTLAVETPQGVKSAFSVVEIAIHGVAWPPGGGRMAAARGEALYLDLGPGRRPLIVLLTKTYREGMPRAHWDEIQPTLILAKIYGEAPDPTDENGDAWRARIAAHRGAREIAPGDLPDLVTFAELNDPKSVVKVDPDRLEATLGPGVKWSRVTLEVADEPVTTGIIAKLPWLRDLGDRYLDGQPTSRRSNLANSLQAWSFIQGITS